MKIVASPYELELKHTFTISRFSRSSTPLMLVEIFYEGYTGLGEASMVPYMGESVASASEFLSLTDLSWLKYPFNYDELTSYLDRIKPGNPNIKAAIDIALHDLQGKIENRPCYQMFGSDPAAMPLTSFTIGIDSPELIVKKVEEAANCRIIKVKLGRDTDKQLIETIRAVSNKPLYADANQGWTDRHAGLDMVHWLHERGVVLIEQPMDKTDIAGNAWIAARSPVPIIADEAVQRLADVDKARGVYHGINMKLMKSAGMHEGHLMIKRAQELDLKVLVGCMSETSIGTLAGAALAPLCNWADLDGPLLTSNNPFADPELKDGRWVLPEKPGLGIAYRQ